MELEKLSTENKMRLIKAIANGSLQKSDLKNPEIVKVLINENQMCLIYSNFCSRDEYRHNGEIVSEDKFNRLKAIYTALYPDRINVVYINEKKRSD